MVLLWVSFVVLRVRVRVIHISLTVPLDYGGSEQIISKNGESWSYSGFSDRNA